MTKRKQSPANEPLPEGESRQGEGAGAEEISALIEAGAQTAAEAEASVTPPGDADALPAPEESQAPRAEQRATAVVPTVQPVGDDEAHKQPVSNRLARESEYDADATNDDRIMAALAYASQLLIPLLVPIVILISETSKKRSFQRYHAIQAIAVAVVIWGLLLALTVMASVSIVTIILALCLCFIVPAMIVLWLLPLYYAILAYNGKRFSIPGITQFLRDQGWV